MLKNLLKKNHMQHIEKVDSWEQAIEMASKPLLKEGVIEDGYVQNMIDSVNQNGPYIVLQDYFALPHAEAGKGVSELGMSLLTLDEPVDLKGNPVKVFLVLAAVDSSSHMEALAEISRLLMDPNSYEIFIGGNIDAIYKLL